MQAYSNKIENRKCSWPESCSFGKSVVVKILADGLEKSYWPQAEGRDITPDLRVAVRLIKEQSELSLHHIYRSYVTETKSLPGHKNYTQQMASKIKCVIWNFPQADKP